MDYTPKMYRHKTASVYFKMNKNTGMQRLNLTKTCKNSIQLNNTDILYGFNLTLLTSCFSADIPWLNSTIQIKISACGSHLKHIGLRKVVIISFNKNLVYWDDIILLKPLNIK